MSDDVTVEIAEAFEDAVRLPACALVAGDSVFDTTGGRHRLIRVTHHPKSKTVTTTREDGVWDRWERDEILTVARTVTA